MCFRLWLAEEHVGIAGRSSTLNPYPKAIPKCHGSSTETLMKVPGVLLRARVQNKGFQAQGRLISLSPLLGSGVSVC